jgi:hypothetical protein
MHSQGMHRRDTIFLPSEAVLWEFPKIGADGEKANMAYNEKIESWGGVFTEKKQQSRKKTFTSWLRFEK